jgi:hypothetical protein
MIISNTLNVKEILRIYLIEQKIYIQITKMSDMSITVIYHTYVSDYIVPMTKDSVDFYYYLVHMFCLLRFRSSIKKSYGCLQQNFAGIQSSR